MAKLELYLQKVKERCDAAEEGPWWIDKPGHVRTCGRDSEFHRYRIVTPGNTEFIAASRTDVPLLLKMVEVVIRRVDLERYEPHSQEFHDFLSGIKGRLNEILIGSSDEQSNN